MLHITPPCIITLIGKWPTWLCWSICRFLINIAHVLQNIFLFSLDLIYNPRKNHHIWRFLLGFYKAFSVQWQFPYIRNVRVNACYHMTNHVTCFNSIKLKLLHTSASHVLPWQQSCVTIATFRLPIPPRAVFRMKILKSRDPTHPIRLPDWCRQLE